MIRKGCPWEKVVKFASKPRETKHLFPRDGHKRCQTTTFCYSINIFSCLDALMCVITLLMDAKFTTHTLIVFMYSCFIVVVVFFAYENGINSDYILLFFLLGEKKSNILTIILNLKHVNCIYNCMLNMYFVQKIIIFFVVDIINMIWLIYLEDNT